LRKRFNIAVVAVACAAAGVTAVGLAGASDEGQSWAVDLGQQAPGPATAPKSVFLDQYIPAKLVINAGDKVTFSSATIHTATYLAGSKPPGLFVPDPANGKYKNIVGADGQPFYFDGLPKLLYNGAALAPSGGMTVPGAGPVSSGVLAPSGNKKSASATFTFPTAGHYRLVCNIHPGMHIDVTVKSAGATLPATPTQVQAQTLETTAAAWKQATALHTSTTAPPNSVVMGVGSKVAMLEFYPQVLKVKVGTTVRFLNRSPSEVHNAAFGPKKWVQQFVAKTDLLPTAPNAPNQVGPYYPYGSEPKGHYQYDGTNHGNGFLATPLTTGTPGVPLPHAAAVTFTKPGTYTYFCMIHGPSMHGTIIVTP
jgi:plastocyanin